MGKNHHLYSKMAVMDFLWLVNSEYKSLKVEIVHPIYTSHSGMGHWWGPHAGEGERTAREAAVAFHTSPLCSWGLLSWESKGEDPPNCIRHPQQKAYNPDKQQKIVLFLPKAVRSSDTQTRSSYRKSVISHMVLTPLLLRLSSTTENLQFMENAFLFFSCLFLCSHFLFSSCSIPPLNMKNEWTFLEHCGANHFPYTI